MIKHRYKQPTGPKKPFKRELTNDERAVLHASFIEHSFNNIDANGHIVLGNGISKAGMYYITEAQLTAEVSKE